MIVLKQHVQVSLLSVHRRFCWFCISSVWPGVRFAGSVSIGKYGCTSRQLNPHSPIFHVSDANLSILFQIVLIPSLNRSKQGAGRNSSKALVLHRVSTSVPNSLSSHVQRRTPMLNADDGYIYSHSFGVVLPSFLVTVHWIRPLGSLCGAYTSASLPVFLRPLNQLKSAYR